MRRKTHKKGIIKYTAFVPRTIKATKNTGSNVIKKIKYFLKNTQRRLRMVSRSLDKSTAKSIRSLTKKQYRK